MPATMNDIKFQDKIDALAADNKDLRDRLCRLGKMVIQNSGRQVSNRDVAFGQKPEEVKAATIPIWDRGGYFSGYPTVEKALQYLGGVAGPTNEKSAILSTDGWFRIASTTKTNTTTVLRIHWTSNTYKGEMVLVVNYPDGGTPRITVLSNKVE